jgi:hypothetical protein
MNFFNDMDLIISELIDESYFYFHFWGICEKQDKFIFKSFGIYYNKEEYHNFNLYPIIGIYTEIDGLGKIYLN